jgi:TolB-like protein/Flp pilus assembly protein TadD
MSFFDELKRRNVVRVGLAYGIAGWVILQIADLVLENIEAPSWVIQALMLFVLFGFIAAVVIAWAYEITPEGIKKESEVDRSQSITAHTGKKLDRIIIGFLLLAVAVLLIERSMSPPIKGPDTPSQDATVQLGQGDDDNTPIPEKASPSDPSIAVLPFADMSADQDQGYFSDGISEELLNVLVKVRGLKVASRTSSFTYKGSNLSLAEIADELKVDHVLEGSVRKANNRVRITAQLIDASTDRHIWSDTFDRELVDIFAIQDEIANAIVAALSAELGILQDTPTISITAATENLDAYELYLQARGLFLERQQLEKSISLYERAVELDPGFAQAWEGLAAVYAVVESWGFTGRDWDSLALQAANRALELNPGLSTPWAVMGQMATRIGDYVSTMANTDRAIELDPNNATNYLWRGIAYSVLGFQTESITDFRRCLEIDPAYANCKRHLALAYMIVNQNELALPLIQQVAKYGFTVINFQSQYLQRLISLDRRLAATMILLFNFDYESGFPATAILDAMEFPERDHSRGLQKLLDWIDSSGATPASFSVPLAAFKAYHLVEPISSQTRWVWLKESAEFRASEYFAPFMHKVGAPAYWREKGFPPGCRSLGGDDFECD